MLLKKDEAAALLTISPRSLDSIIKSGALPYVVMGKGTIRIDSADLEAYIRRCKKTRTGNGRRDAKNTERPCLYIPGMKVV